LSDRHVIEVRGQDIPLAVRADAGRIQQVMLNLLSNAMTHATGTERITVEIARDDGWAVISVIDEGPGIPPDEVGSLFARYRQAGKPGRGGLGLGLFISREIVTAHGGTIEAVSTPGVGTTIRIRLPLLGSASARGDGPLAPADGAASTNASKRVGAPALTNGAVPARDGPPADDLAPAGAGERTNRARRARRRQSDAGT
jgi:hypothetical protein